MGQIHKEETIERIMAKINSGQWSESVIFGMKKAIKIIEAMPERPQGEWKKDDYAGIYCSECFYIPLKEEVKTIHADGTEERSGNFNLTPFCPNCGADMTEGGGKE